MGNKVYLIHEVKFHWQSHRKHKFVIFDIMNHCNEILKFIASMFPDKYVYGTSQKICTHRISLPGSLHG